VSTKPLIFVDGEEGTTGLQIFDRLTRRPDLELLKIDPDRRKDPEARRALLNEADVAWDWAAGRSDYTDVVASGFAGNQGRSWLYESSIGMSLTRCASHVR